MIQFEKHNVMHSVTTNNARISCSGIRYTGVSDSNRLLLLVTYVQMTKCADRSECKVTAAFLLGLPSQSNRK